MKQPKRIQRSEADWQALIHEHATSRLSVKDFCNQHHIGDPSFYSWRKRLQSRMIEAPAINLVDITSIVTADPPRWHIELDLGDGIKLNLRQA